MKTAGMAGIIGPLLGVSLLRCAGTACAAAPEPAGQAVPSAGHEQPRGWSELAGFDLAAHKSRSAAPAMRLPRSSTLDLNDDDAEQSRVGFRESGRNTFAGPSWSYQLRQGSPVLELAALGAGRKGTPGLLHLAFDWNF